MNKTFQQNFLANQVAVVTGGATGICYGISLAYLKYGCKVLITSRKEEVLKQSCVTLAKESGNDNIAYFPCDVRKFEQVEAMVQFALDKWGRIDILVNGAAGNFLVPFEMMSVNAFRSVMEIDTFGTFHCCKAVVAKWMSKNGGVIINISTTLPHCGVALQSHAGTAKAGIDALTRHLAVELGPKRIRVVGIAPGAIEKSEGFKRLRMDDSSGFGEDFEKLLPLQRAGNNDDIAPWALFLASDCASYITGQTIIVDGGAVNTFPNFTLLSKKARDMLKPKL
ncbi:unnamed protein product (macronuclear) [Paramecium tetraurelia]|uniref:2,4-dienoyl-CoA reductase [(3E)-enoyl-CoA-producing] n=1 Tax=Paramecium tetraurelia TaxID=5888 RepID=A0C8U1_PARTE|nr:uncharacterized protein GSPATT00036343001 [Paramecium tetraurelia]CAK67208.1 unnamed protein product [Paramecium tetraurelia]|eukprot:XP_001434605.1 hypothetical protein (macronuclear) [Paramecium tetraurelia strain d4-2]